MLDTWVKKATLTALLPETLNLLPDPWPAKTAQAMHSVDIAVVSAFAWRLSSYFKA